MAHRFLDTISSDMHLTKILPAIVQSSPRSEIEGRKRLQKLVHLLQLSGADVEADYYLLHYGPFSDEVASVAEDLVYEGTLSEIPDARGPYKTFQYVYKLGEWASLDYQLGKMDKNLIAMLGDFSTVELEVASTIGYFENVGKSREEAIEETRLLKPSKTSNESVMIRAESILELVDATAKKRTAYF